MTPVAYASDKNIVPCVALFAGTGSGCVAQEKWPLYQAKQADLQRFLHSHRRFKARIKEDGTRWIKRKLLAPKNTDVSLIVREKECIKRSCCVSKWFH